MYYITILLHKQATLKVLLAVRETSLRNARLVLEVAAQNSHNALWGFLVT